MTFDPFTSSARRSGIGRSYVSPGQIAMGLPEGDQVPMAHFIPGGGFGGKSVGKGTVIPHHKPGRGGGSLGYNPHKPPNRHVLVDPHVPGRAVALDLSKVRKQDSQEAFRDGMDFANEFMENPPEKLDNIEMGLDEGPRLGAYVATKLLAERYGAAPDDVFGRAVGPHTLQLAPGGQAFDDGRSRPAMPPPGMTGQAKAASFGAPTVGRETPIQVVTGRQPAGVHAQHQPDTPAAARAVAPGQGVLARFQQPRPQPAATEQPRYGVPADGRGNPPTRKVVFEFGSKLPVMPLLYHDVIRASAALILVWDLEWPYGEPYSPEGYEEQFALSVEGAAEDYLVISPGKTFTFEHHGFRFYHLGIIDSRPKQ